jgi:hypothetical protein
MCHGLTGKILNSRYAARTSNDQREVRSLPLHASLSFMLLGLMQVPCARNPNPIGTEASG